MPIGIIINALCIFVGGFIGLFARNFISERIITNLNMIFGLCSMGMGISSIVLMENMPAVIFALILGTGIGLAIHLGDKIPCRRPDDGKSVFQNCQKQSFCS